MRGALPMSVAAAAVGLLVIISCTIEPAQSFETCCLIQSACDGCTDVFEVNSITYCCPFCQMTGENLHMGMPGGQVLVTNLVCRCNLVNVDPATFVPNCTLSNDVVGGYMALKPSLYTINRGGGVPAATSLCVVAALITAFVAKLSW